MNTSKNNAGEKEHIVVIGGGFAGLNFVKRIDKKRYDVTLIDRHNFHSFPPLFYQVAASELDPGSISFPFRRELTKRKAKGVHFRMGRVDKIDMLERTVVTEFESIPFDKLIIAAGTTNNFFGSPDLIKKVYTLKSTPEALRLRNEILDRLERASVSKDEDERRRMLTFVVVGAGPTGVEIAGALGEVKRYIISREYPELRPEELSIVLLEGSDRVLQSMSVESSRAALEALGSLMVEVRLGVVMSSYDDNCVVCSDGTRIESETVVWTAGIAGEPLEIVGAEVERGRGNRFVTDEHCRVVGLDDVYAIGDISLTVSQMWPHGYPQLAQVAIQQARFVADCLNKGDEGIKAFSYVDKGSMATIGRNRAVADLKHLKLSGFIAWIAWMAIHLLTLLGMRNRIVVFINWIWAYFSYSTSLRLLIHATRYPLRPRWER